MKRRRQTKAQRCRTIANAEAGANQHTAEWTRVYEACYLRGKRRRLSRGRARR